MTVKHISASKYQIKIYTDAVGGSLCAKAFLPLINASSPDRFKDAKLIAESSATDGCVVFDRYSGGFDLALCRSEVTQDGETAGGVCYVDELEDGYSKICPARKRAKKPVGTWVTAKD